MTGPDRFVWPPRAPASPSLPDSTDSPESPPPAATARRDVAGASPGVSATSPEPGWIGSIETHLLGRKRAPLRERLADAGWSPDAPGSWCRRCGELAGPFEVSNHGHTASGAMLASRGRDDRCPACRGRRLAWERSVRAGSYEGELRTALLEAKNARWRRLASDLGRLLAPALEAALREDGVPPAGCVLVPVPIAWRRQASGAIDHTHGICRGLRGATGIRIARLLWSRPGPKQVEVAPSARAANVRARLRVRPRSLSAAVSRDMRRPEGGGTGPADAQKRGRPVLLVVDDIRTSGATMSAACRALRRAWRRMPGADQSSSLHPRLWCVTVAVTAPRNRRSGARNAGFSGSGPQREAEQSLGVV